MRSSRRRISQKTTRSRTNDTAATAPSADLTKQLRQLEDAVNGLKTEMLHLTRKVVSLEAELDHVHGKRGLQ